MARKLTEIITYEVSVKGLVEFAVAQGDLVYRNHKTPTGLEGIRAHQFIQKKRPSDYTPEFFVKDEIVFGDYRLMIRGRMDGIFQNSNPIVIEEIKSSYLKYQDISDAVKSLHLAQAKVYACIYLRIFGGLGAGIQMTYFDLVDNIQEAKYYTFSFQELSDFYFAIVEIYAQWQNKMHLWLIQRNQSLVAFNFPFPEFRKGQRQLSVDVYRAIRDRNRLYLQAPTGIGKTLGVLFPALKNLGEGNADRIFFLTAKTVGKKVVEETISRVQVSCRLKTISLTAKDKICFQVDGKPCNPEICVYAKNYYDKLRNALAEIWNYELFDKETIEKIALEHEICPFEFSLDLANWCDLIICDYNYIFDPFVYLRRFFDDDNGKNSVLLIDEANHLVDRSRSMYSASVTRYGAFHLQQMLLNTNPDISATLLKIEKAFKAVHKKISGEKWEFEACVLNDIPKGLTASLSSFQELIEAKLGEGEGELWPIELHGYYFEVNRFLKIKEFFDRNYRFIFKVENNHWEVKLFCLDPSSWLLTRLNAVRAAIFFSATFTPFNYFSQLIENSNSVLTAEYPSPFNPELQKMAIDDKVSTFYQERSAYYDIVVERVLSFIKHKAGNYLIFTPSFSYLNEISDKLKSQISDINVIVQKKNMTEGERDLFLNEFNSGLSVIGLAVLGGIFSEGIDLVGEKLIGVCVIGVGLPSPSAENETLKKHFADRFGDGFLYTYLLPGFHKVQQAVGRLIRTETDTGAILLLDKRYGEARYRRLFPKHWKIGKDFTFG